MTLLLLDLDASEGVAHHLLHESPAHGSLDRGLLGGGSLFPPPANAVKESFAPPDVVFDVVVVAVSAFRKGALPKSVMVVDMVSVQNPIPRVAGGRLFSRTPGAVTRVLDAGDARTPGSNARARARTMQRPERSEATRSGRGVTAEPDPAELSSREKSSPWQ